MKKRMDERTFRAVKTMERAMATAKEIAEYLGISTATVYRMVGAETWEEYKNICAARAIAARKHTPAPAPVQAPAAPVQAPVAPVSPTAQAYVNNRVYELMKEQNEYLKLISAKLAFLVEALS